MTNLLSALRSRLMQSQSLMAAGVRICQGVINCRGKITENIFVLVILV